MPKRQAQEWYRIETAAANGKAPKSAEVLIYDYIDEFGVSAQQFATDIKALDVDQLDVRINSPGGSAFDGIAIFNALKRHPATVTTYNDGLAASAASFIAQAGDKRVTSKYAETMVHGPSSVVVGNADDMRSVADRLDKLNGNMAQLYADVCGGTVKDWLAVMAAETWFTGEEAVKAGLFDEVDDSDEDEDAAASRPAAVAAAAARFDYSAFRYAGRQAAPAPFATATTKEKTMADTKTDEAAKAAADEEKAKADKAEADKAAADKAEADKAEADKAEADKAEADKASAAAAAQARVAPEGTVIVDAEVWRNTQEQARLGAEAHATLRAQGDAKIVDAAIDKGKITPARRKHYLAALTGPDREHTIDLLNNQLEAGAAVPLDEIGHAAAKSDTDPVAQLGLDNPLFAEWKV